MDTVKVQVLRQAMGAYAQRTQAINANLANLDTPGYRRMNVSFEEYLQDLRGSVPGARDAGDLKTTVSLDDEAPVLEHEMLDLAETNMRNQLASRALREHFELMRTGITGRPQ
jgi:flagellar basal-body rod protein FlgB